MKKVLLTAIAVLVSSAAFAQAAGGAAAGGSTATKQEVTSQKSPSEQKTADKAEMKVDARKGMTPAPMANANTPAMMAMDTNGDGMISRREYDTYHSTMWKSMKQSKGMVSQSDMDLMRKGGPAGN